MKSVFELFEVFKLRNLHSKMEFFGEIFKFERFLTKGANFLLRKSVLA